jgi:hypothetical protein
VGIPLIFIAIGSWQVVEQRRKMTSYVEGKGEVVTPGPEVKVRTGTGKNRSTTYTPVVRYRYESRGSIYRSESVFPVSGSVSKSRAYEVVNQFPVGRAVKVYYDPADPGQAFLVRRWEFWPYLFVMFPMVHFAIGLGLLAAGVWGGSDAKAMEPIQAREGGFELRPRMSVGRKKSVWMLLAGVWWGVGLLACGHYFMVAERPYATEALIGSAVYFGLGTIVMVLAVRYWLLARNTSDARVVVDRHPVRPGQGLDVRVEQAFMRHLLIESAGVGLVLERTQETSGGGKKRVETTKVWEEWANEVVKNEQATPGRPLTMKHRFVVPGDQAGSSDAGEKGYPRYAWWVEVKVKIADAPDYAGKFGVVVR